MRDPRAATSRTTSCNAGTIVATIVVWWLVATPAASEEFNCDSLTVQAPPQLYRLGFYWTSGSRPVRSNEFDKDPRFLAALEFYQRELEQGSVSLYFREHIVPAHRKRMERGVARGNPHFVALYERLMTAIERLRPFHAGVEQRFEELARTRHKLALRCLGYIHQFGIGVPIDVAKAWAFHDTYNLVAGEDGRDLQRDLVEKAMDEDQKRSAYFWARWFREVYTDAWKLPSTTIVR